MEVKSSVNPKAKTVWIMDDETTQKIWACSQKKFITMANLLKLKSIIHTEINDLIEFLRKRERELGEEIDDQSFHHYADIEKYMLTELSAMPIVVQDSLDGINQEGSVLNQKLLPADFQKSVTFFSNFGEVKKVLQNTIFGEVKLVGHAVEETETVVSKQSVEQKPEDVKVEQHQSANSEELTRPNFSSEEMESQIAEIWRQEVEKVEEPQTVLDSKEPTRSNASFEVIEPNIANVQRIDAELIIQEKPRMMEQLQSEAIRNTRRDSSFEEIESHVAEIQKTDAELTDEEDIDFVPETESSEIPSWQPIEAIKVNKSHYNALVETFRHVQRKAQTKCSPNKEKDIADCIRAAHNFMMNADHLKECDKTEDTKTPSISAASEHLTDTKSDPTLKLQQQQEKFKMIKKWSQDVQSSMKTTEINSSVMPQVSVKEENSILVQSKEEMSSMPRGSNLLIAKFFPNSSRKASTLCPIQSKQMSPSILLQSSLDVYLEKDNAEKWLYSEDLNRKF